MPGADEPTGSQCSSAPPPNPALVVVGLGFGDEGKGSVIDALASRLPPEESALVVRYNGGPQAAHRVVRPDGREHIFSQFGSAQFLSSAKTHLSQFTLVDPFALEAEAEALDTLAVRNCRERWSAHGDCVVVTPYHRLANRVREILRGDRRHGSCGVGVGEAALDAATGRVGLRLRELSGAGSISALQELAQTKLELCRQLLASESGNPGAGEVQRLITEHEDQALPEYVAQRAHAIMERYPAFARTQTQTKTEVNRQSPPSASPPAMNAGPAERRLYEGAQGALLHPHFGFFPFVSVTDTSSAHAQELESGTTIRLGVLRALPSRHGPGPFVTESKDLTRMLPDAANRFHPFQREFRRGWFDLITARYALAFAGVDHLVLTHLDQLQVASRIKVCVAYQVPEDLADEDLFEFEKSGSVKRIIAIKLPEPEDYERQRRLTNALARCRPIYQEVDPGYEAEKFVSFITDRLSVPVAGGSYGPTATHKQWNADFLSCAVLRKN